MPSMTGESHDDPDHGRRQLSGPRLVARLQHPREPPRCDAGRAQDPGTGRHRRGRRRRALSLGHQPPRDQRDDRLLRPTPPGGPGRADPGSAPAPEAQDRNGLPVAACRERHGPARPRAAQPRARLYALPRLTPKPTKFTVTSPYMLAKVLDDGHYGSLGALVMALADLLKAQLAE